MDAKREHRIVAMTHHQRVSDFCEVNSQCADKETDDATALGTEAASVNQAVRALLTPEQNAACDDAMVLRYWRATGKDIKHAARRLQDTLRWWAAENPSAMFCPACRQDPSSHYMQCVGRDLSGRPLIYSCMELASNKNVEDNRRHMISIFETAIALMPPGVESWSWVLDFHGFSIKDCDPRLARIFLHLAATHYPERLGHFWIVDAPALFGTLWSAISRFIDPKTRQKIAFVNMKKREKLEESLRPHFDAEMVKWLTTEMEENRARGSKEKGSKCYDFAALARLKEEGVGQQNGCHCNLGSDAFLEELRNWPGPLPHQVSMNARQQPTTKDSQAATDSAAALVKEI